MARIDQHIMDDADLAGPFLFCALFGTFLLLVGVTAFNNVMHLLTLAAVRQALVWLCMWPCCAWRLRFTLRVQHDVTASNPRRRSSCTEPPARLPWKLALLVDPHSWTIKLSAWILLASVGLRKLTWCGIAFGYVHWLLPRQLGHRMVHIL